MNDKVFTSVILSNGQKIDIVECKGKHYFAALLKCNGSTSTFPKFLTLELARFNGSKLTENDLDEMDLSDLQSILEPIALMIDNNYLK